MFIDVNVYNKTMPHMADHYESDVVSYWKKMQEFDYLLTRQEEKVNRFMIHVGVDVLAGVSALTQKCRQFE